MPISPRFQAISGLPRPFGRSIRIGLPSILVLALVVRVTSLVTPRSYFPDEIFQYLEPAHRLVFGQAVVPWEYRYGIRSWILPLLLAGPMALGGWLASASGLYLFLPKLLLVIASLGTIIAGFAIGSQISRSHGLFAAFALAIWSETALFSTQALTEAVAVAPILGGAALLGTRNANRGRWLAGGALLALGVVLRFQYAPAIAVLGAVACGRDRKGWTLTVVGGAAMLVAAGGLDVAMGQRPYGWIVENFHQNIGLKRSHAWTDGPFFYPLAIAAMFGVTLLPAWLLARRVAVRFPALVACAVVNIVAHTLIAHKEYRYVLLSTTILVLLAAIGTVDAIEARRARGDRTNWMAVAIAGWIASSILAFAIGVPHRFWRRVTPELRAFVALRNESAICGIAVVGDHWANTGGYAYLHRAIPLYIPDDEEDPAAVRALLSATAGYNAVMAPASRADILPPEYRRTGCYGRHDRACVFERTGGCDPAAAARYEINRVLVRIDR